MSEQEQKTGTAVARREDSGDELSRLSREGRLRVERKKEMQELYNAVKGAEFGEVDGAHMSKETRYKVAKMCMVVRANPAQHVDVLGGRPYLNAAYWEEEINTHPAFIRYDQRDLSESTEQAIRDAADDKEELAEEVREKAQETGNEELAGRADRLEVEAMDLREEADDLKLARAKWGVPDVAEAAVETTITRFVNAAPMEKIRAGDVDREPWVKQVHECNWAPNSQKQDPVGRDNPAKTARTRSLRRAAVKAFPSWREKFNDILDQAEKAIEADIDLMGAVEGPDLPEGDEPQALTGSGEPEARSAEGARELPEVGEESGTEVLEGANPDEGDEASEDEINEARKTYFGNLRAHGITEDEDRYAWQERHDLPGSVKDFGLSDFRAANALLTEDAKREYVQACDALGVDAVDFADETLGFQPRTIPQYEELVEALEETPVGEEADEAQPEMELDQ